MICIVNFKNKVEVNKQKKIINDINLANLTDKILIAPTLIEENNYSNLQIISQNISIKNRSVGEISPGVLKHLNISYSILGHLERRINDLDNLDTIKDRLENSLENNICPILCLGISKDLEVIKEELDFLLLDVDLDNREIIIAYEDIESTLKGKQCYSYDEIKEIYKFIDNYLKDKSFLGNFNYRILFGGAVTENNIKNIKEIGFDGVLLGDRYGTFEPIVTIINNWNTKVLV